ncbi:MAG: sulfurtransferase TusA family protein [Nitrospirae bacterium]|nr:sulfurtransferase TusA family protein [Nitrospirota bacterium]
MPGAVKADQTLDCKGLLCPLPVIRTKQAIDKMTIGQVLEMLSTDPGSVADMAAWSRRTGHELLDQRTENGLFQFYIRKTK